MSDDPELDSPAPSMPPAEFCTTLAAARSGDSQARDILVRHVYPHVERMVHVALARDLRRRRPWLLTRFSTGDVVQEVFYSLIQDLGSFAGSTEAAFIGYLAMIVRNRLMDAIRHHEAAQRDGRLTTQVSDGAEGEARSEHEGLDAAGKDELELFHAALETLPERDRLLLRARLEQEATFESLAEMLGFPSKFAARRAFYAAQATLVIRMRQRSLRGSTRRDDRS